MTQARFVIVGTAGHIDHGKTALVFALTGKNTDRLKEEEARGISIDIDFAPLRFDDGLLIGMVDVPGHERFIRNMLAGAAGIDAALLSIDVNEGIKPQTLEHLSILEMLGVSRLVVALTKCDLADPEWIEMVRDVVLETLSDTPYADSPMIATSAVTGTGLSELRDALHELAEQTTLRDPSGAFRQPVDKVFSIPGFGTVVSGTVWRGTVSVGDHLECLPGRTPVRVRGIQSHGKSVSVAEAGQRAALNLVGVSHDELRRGYVLAAPGTLTQTRLLDVHLSVLPRYESGLVHRHRVHVHLGTAQTVGRVLLLEGDSLEAGGAAYAQLLLEHMVVCEPGDHFVLRSYSPVTTIGGGHVVDAAPERLYRRKRPHVIAALEARDTASPTERVVQMAHQSPQSTAAIAARLGSTPEEAEGLVKSAEKAGRLVALPSGWLATDTVANLLDECAAALTEAHRKYRFRPFAARRDVTGPWLRQLSTRDVDWLLQEGSRAGRWELSSGMIRAFEFEVQLSDDERMIYRQMLDTLDRCGIEGKQRGELTATFPKRDRVADALLHYAADRDEALTLADGNVAARTVFDEAVNKIRTLFEQQGEFTVAQVRDLLSSSRKPTVNLLETMDNMGITMRDGDVRRFVSRHK